MWGNPFLTLENVKKGFPHILNVWNWLKWISSHFSTHSSELEKSKEKFLTFFQCVEFRQTLFSLHQFHTCGKFLTFSWHFPDIFLTLKFHSDTYFPSLETQGEQKFSEKCSRQHLNHKDRGLSSNQSRLGHTFPERKRQGILLVQASSFILGQNSIHKQPARLLRSPPRFFKLWKTTQDLFATFLVDSGNSAVAILFLWRPWECWVTWTMAEESCLLLSWALTGGRSERSERETKKQPALLQGLAPQGRSFSGFRHSFRHFCRLFLQTGLAKCAFFKVFSKSCLWTWRIAAVEIVAPDTLSRAPKFWTFAGHGLTRDVCVSYGRCCSSFFFFVVCKFTENESSERACLAHLRNNLFLLTNYKNLDRKAFSQKLKNKLVRRVFTYCKLAIGGWARGKMIIKRPARMYADVLRCLAMCMLHSFGANIER